MKETFLHVVLPTTTLVTLCVSVLGYLVWRLKLKPYLRKLAKEIGVEVEEGVSRAIETHLPRFQQRVKDGMIEGITDMPNHTTKLTSEMIRGGIKNFNLFNLMKPFDPEQEK